MNILIVITSILNLRRFVMPRWLLRELLKHIPSYVSGPLLVFCDYAKHS